MTLSVFRRAHLLVAEVQLCGQVVVGAATQSHVGDAVLATPPERPRVMKLQTMRLRAASPRVVDMRAAQPISLVHRTPNGSRDRAPALAR